MRVGIGLLLLILNVIVSWALSSEPRVLAAPDAVSVEFRYYPRYIMAQPSATNEAVFPVLLRITGLNSAVHACLQVQWRVSTFEGGSRYNTATESWQAASNYIDHGTGNEEMQLWVFLRNTAATNTTLGTPGNTGQIRVRVREAPTPCTTTSATTTAFLSPDNEIAVIDNATTCTVNCGGWISETASQAAAGDMIVAKENSTIVGIYRASMGDGEKNDVWPGYPPYDGDGGTVDGYYKIPVPACAACSYTIERWDYDNPNGSAIPNTTVNTMPDSNSNNSVTAGQTTILTFDTPTAVQLTTLQTTTATIPAVAFAAVLMLLTGTAVALRRRP
jgi:hypothetical protein